VTTIAIDFEPTDTRLICGEPILLLDACPACLSKASVAAKQLAMRHFRGSEMMLCLIHDSIVEQIARQGTLLPT
jgi:hypothetical protein